MNSTNSGAIYRAVNPLFFPSVVFSTADNTIFDYLVTGSIFMLYLILIIDHCSHLSARYLSIQPRRDIYSLTTGLE